MDLQLKGHVAIVQGASKGIGRGIAEALAAEGCNLVLTARTPDTLEAAALDIATRHGVIAEPMAMDSAEIAALPSVVSKAIAGFGRLDIIVANSGGPAPGGFRDLAIEQWRAAAELVLISPVALLQAALPYLERSPAPRFFVVTSSSTREPVVGLTLSNTLRPGVVGLIKTLALELGPRGICCHSLAPGRIDTDRLAAVIQRQATIGNKSTDDVRAAMLGSIPLGRLGTTGDFGNVTAFLASPRASYLTGLNILIDGGLIKSI